MDSFDKKMKDSLSHYDEKIPDGMSWDEMAGGIEAKMPAKRRRFVPILFWVGVGLLVTGGIAGINKYSKSSTKEVVEYGSTKTTKEKPSQEKIDNEIIRPTATETKFSAEIETTVLADITKTEGISVPTSSSDEKLINTDSRKLAEPLGVTKSVNTKKNKHINASKPKQSTTENTDLVQEKPNTSSEVKNFVSFGANKENGDSIENRVDLSNVDKQSSQDLGGLFDQSLALSFFEWKMRPETLQYKEFPIIPAKKDYLEPALALSYYMALDGGVTFWDWNQEYSADFDISNFEREQLSYNSHLIFGANLSKSFALESGLSFYSLESEFNNVFETETKEDGQHEVYNVITRKYESHAGEVVVTNRRTIRNYNSIKQFSIPLIAIYRMNLGKFGAGIGAGPELQIANIASGRTINKIGEFVDYTDNSTLNQAIGLGATARIELAYDLYDNLSVYSSIRYKGSITNWTSSSEIARNPNLFSIGLGIRKTF